MLFAFDIGNTNITFGIFKYDKLVSSYRLTTSNKRTSDEFGMMITSFMLNSKVTVDEIDDVIVSSVVPKIMHSFNNSIRKYLKKEPIIVGPGIKSGISLKIDDPRSLGADRLVDAVGAYYLYKGPVIVVDFGTATTFDYVNEKAEFIGGMTAPGIEISAQALASRAAKLPEIEIKDPNVVLAKNTITSMQAGTVYGYTGLVEYIIKKMKEDIKARDDLKVVATGGLGRILSNQTDSIDIYDPDLSFKGLKIIYDKSKKR